MFILPFCMITSKTEKALDEICDSTSCIRALPIIAVSKKKLMVEIHKDFKWPLY